MAADPSTAALARHLTGPAPSGRGTALFLGQECGRIAGVPPLEEIAATVLEGLDRATGGPALRPRDETSLEALSRLLEDMPVGRRVALLMHFTARLPVPLLYQDAATVSCLGGLRTVFTTNVDTLLERALEGTGLVRGHDFRVLSVGGSDGEVPAWADPDGPLTIVKLHGDLATGSFVLTTDEIASTLAAQRDTVEPILDDVVLVGYQLDSAPLLEWLATTPGRLWWVVEDAPPEVLTRLDQVRQVHRIPTGPERFFAELAVLLLRQPVVDAMRESLSALGPAAGPATSDEDFESVLVRARIRRCEDVLRRLETQAVPGDGNQRLKVQLAYQRQELERLETELRQVEAHHLLTVLEQIDERVQGRSDASVGPGTAAYMHGLVSQAAAQVEQSSSNEHITSALLGAISILSDRVGVEPDLVQELNGYTPTTARAWSR